MLNVSSLNVSNNWIDKNFSLNFNLPYLYDCSWNFSKNLYFPLCDFSLYIHSLSFLKAMYIFVLCPLTVLLTLFIQQLSSFFSVLPRSESGVLSSFVSYFSLSESSSAKGPTLEELEAGKVAASCVKECQLDQLIIDSKFLREDSLQELIKVSFI